MLSLNPLRSSYTVLSSFVPVKKDLRPRRTEHWIKQQFLFQIGKNSPLRYPEIQWLSLPLIFSPVSMPELIPVQKEFMTHISYLVFKFRRLPQLPDFPTIAHLSPAPPDPITVPAPPLTTHTHSLSLAKFPSSVTAHRYPSIESNRARADTVKMKLSHWKRNKLREKIFWVGIFSKFV